MAERNSYALFGRVFDVVNGTVIENGVVIIEGDRIVAVGIEGEFPVAPEAVQLRAPEGGSILPGFIDCHTHLTGEEDAGPYRDHALFGDQLLGAAWQVGLLLEAGFTSVRDMSEQGCYLERARARGILRSPKIMPGGRCLGISSGHGDIWPFTDIDDFNRVNSISRLCDGVDDCIRAVREQFRNGAKFIKILATGGVSSPMDDVNDVQFSFEEMKAIVDEAHRHQSYVAAHCTGHEGAYQALLAGVECIEHGVLLTQREIDLMAERNIPLVTTLAVSLGAANIPTLPEWLSRKAKACAAANLETIAMARKAGIRIALGTDFSNSPNSSYLKNGSEFRAMLRAGMTPMEALQAGTINAAFVLRKDQETGSLTAGKLADIVICDGNPLENIGCITDAQHILHVFQDGVKIK